MSAEEKLGEEIMQTNDAWILKDGRTGVGWQLDIIGKNLYITWLKVVGLSVLFQVNGKQTNGKTRTRKNTRKFLF